MKIQEVNAKSSLVKSKLSQFTVNPYMGCGHGCRYCYASMIMQRFHHKNENWGDFVDVRINTPRNLEKELKNKNEVRIYMSSMTDCYQPIEKKYEVTRKALKVILFYEKTLFPKKHSITMQTKSSLVLRDLDILKELSKVEVGLTITTLDEHYASIFEPGASLPSERLKALEMLNKTGIKTYAFFGPVLPGISDSFEKMKEIIREIYNAGTKSIIIDKLNYFGNLPRLKNIARELNLYNQFFFTLNEDYRNELRQKLSIIQKEHRDIYFDIVF
jgi:DNA repair photolyase